MLKIATWVLNRLFHYVDIGKGDDLYMRRWFLMKTRWGQLRVHLLARSDADPDPHDHPWDFWTMPLINGYTEEWWWVFCPTDHANGNQTFEPRRGINDRERKVRTFKLYRRMAEYAHRVIIAPGKPALTLVWCSNPYRDWGFITESGWVHWRTYLGVPESETPESAT